jgi:hypothetical protein
MRAYSMDLGGKRMISIDTLYEEARSPAGSWRSACILT